ncbi:Fic family protein [Konateibacter massiliensis]|uniref:Fic family protein n=1 Tax=Konateibacter massiliensis TaxID=2002841 RepID=UPI000C14472D|nr:Fic family protein [Konateibacter massiliensis]
MQTIKDSIKQADACKEKRSSLSLPEEKKKEIEGYFHLHTTYSSNTLDGNSLTLEETKEVLETGRPCKGKSSKDCYEALGHGAAYDFMLSLASQPDLPITKENILKLHELFYEKIDSENAGKLRTAPRQIAGTRYLPPPPEELEHLMEHLADQLDSSKYSLHPLELAALSHKRLLDIHPFAHGNGRVARLLMNLILVNTGYGVTLIPLSLRDEYISALATSRKLYNPDPITKMIAECVVETNKEYCRLLGNTDK